MRRDWIVVCCVLALGIGGCNKGSQPSADSAGATAARASGVAVIDMDMVAHQLGKDVDLLSAIREGQSTVAQQLQAHQTSLQQQFQQKVDLLKAEPVADPDAEKTRQQQLAELQQQYKVQLNQVARSAQKELKTHEQKLLQQFRDEIKPVAQQVAAERGLGVVVTKNESVLLSFDDAHDITADVVAKMRASQPAGGAVERTATSTSGPVRSTLQLR